jgi:hypothetical protein
LANKLACFRKSSNKGDALKLKIALCLVLLAQSLTYSTASAEAATTKSISLKWKSQIITQTYEPDEEFVPGKNFSAAFLKKEASSWCLTLFPFVNAEVLSASYKDLGASSVKATKKSLSIITADWQENEYGEDEFSLAFKCSGSFLIPVASMKTKHYILFINAQWPKAPTKNNPSKYEYFNIGSPNFNLEDLNSVNWVVSVELKTYDDEIHWRSFKDYLFEIWNPVGYEYLS